ncbi:hypothetical protein DSL92_01860 [Billgrantia gudaonensis]|uniref:Uncharacterized protein n=1 Tax=Billgrantia gudaonensis TaxID=376427 RepID=A0A3S0QG86_9GAMM|nr:hypothetical protein DSL92_01860 [Halomonas gudaonensis]
MPFARLLPPAGGPAAVRSLASGLGASSGAYVFFLPRHASRARAVALRSPSSTGLLGRPARDAQHPLSAPVARASLFPRRRYTVAQSLHYPAATAAGYRRPLLRSHPTPCASSPDRQTALFLLAASSEHQSAPLPAGSRTRTTGDREGSGSGASRQHLERAGWRLRGADDEATTPTNPARRLDAASGALACWPPTDIATAKAAAA